MSKNENDIYLTGYEHMSEGQKIQSWSQWSSKSYSFPPDVEELIYFVNNERGFNSDHTYGFKVVYYMLMEGWGKEYTEQYFKVDYFGYQVLYPSKM